jgi:O-antigen/teichoic acid export membrane protein
MAIYGGGDFVFRFIAFAVFPIYTSLFSVNEFGIMELVNTFSGLVSIFIGLGMTNAVQRFYWDPMTGPEGRPRLISTGFVILTLWSILFTSGTVVALSLFSEEIKNNYNILLSFMLLALASNIPIQMLQYSLDTLRLQFSPWKFMLLSGWRNLSGVALGLLFIWVFKMGLLGFFLGILLAPAVSVPFGLWLIRKDLTWRFDRKVAGEVVRFGTPFVFAGLAYWFFGSLDRWMLATMVDNTQVGLFSIAFKFASLLAFVNFAFGQAWSPFAVKIYADCPDYRTVFSRILLYLFFGLSVIGASLTLFAKELLHLLTPEPYWPAATVVGILAMGMVLQGTTQITSLGIALERKTHLISYIAWMTAGINLVLNWLLIPKYGALGSGTSIFLSYGVLTGLYLYWTQKLHPIPLEMKKLLLIFCFIFVVLLLSSFINTFSWSPLIFLYKLIFFALLLLFVGFIFKKEGLYALQRLRSSLMSCS